MEEIVLGLESKSGWQVQQCLAQLPQSELSPAVLAALAFTWHRWATKEKGYPYTDYAYYKNFQANRLEWRVFEDEHQGEAIQASIAERLQKALPASWQSLLAAAALFNYAYPICIPVGNGDAVGYEMDCQSLWKDFEPFKEWFRGALPLSKSLRCEWVTIAQIFWYHFRWQPDYSDEGTFSEPACSYFLEIAVTLDVPYPIQYYYIYKTCPYLYLYDSFEGEEITLQSNLGLTYFFYAQFCQYHRRSFSEALAYYRKFLQAEPGFLPDNHFFIFGTNAQKRNYPPSVQEALTEIGNIYLEEGKYGEATRAFEQAIAVRPHNFQAPYERLAEALRQQGNIRESLLWLNKKLEACLQTSIKKYHGTYPVDMYFYYDPRSTDTLRLSQFSQKMVSDPWTRIRPFPVGELYKQLADSYLYELFEYKQFTKYYKKYLTYPHKYSSDKQALSRTVEVYESQIRIAMDQHDFWQARALCEKLLKYSPENTTAQ